METGYAIHFTPGQIATLVCQLEVSAAKPGNVHRAADFEDATLIDFLNSGVALGHAIDHDPAASVGEMIARSVRATGWITDTNTNLGIILLLCPLANVFRTQKSINATELLSLVQSIKGREARLILEAIGSAKAGGLGTSEKYDVRDPATLTDLGGSAGDLMSAMKLAEQRDMIARQFCNGFADVFGFVLPAIVEGRERLKLLSSAIVYAHVKTMAEFPDSLIERKLGRKTAIQSAGYAQAALDAFAKCDLDFSPYWDAVSDLDFWLRSDHHRRNPGTTADLITAALYVGVATGALVPPFR